MNQRRTGGALAGVAYGLGAGLIWGLGPVYWKALQTVPANEIVAHRVVGSVAFLALLIALLRQMPTFRRTVRVRGNLLPLFVTGIVISLNWGLYIWAVNAGHVLEVSLGYFMSPLVGVLLGVTVLHERLRPWQLAAVLLAGLGVVNQAVAVGSVPWIGLALALSFGVYGLIRKMIRVEALVGLGIEICLMLPFALFYIAFLSVEGGATAWSLGAFKFVLLVGAGAVTALPLLWFTQAARRLRLSTIGLVLYVAPSCQFLLAVFLYGETFSTAHLVTFACIWVGLAIYSIDSTLAYRRSAAIDSF
jgi:chloramphenicol-sensitive protein RarD